MQKEELLHIHMLMLNIRIYFEHVTHAEILTERYNSLKISPLHIHKGKNAHRDALLTLGDAIVYHIHNQRLPAVNSSPETAPRLAAAEQ